MVMLFSRCVVTMMVNECQVQPHLMVAALILWTAEAQRIVRNGERTMQTYFPFFKRVRFAGVERGFRGDCRGGFRRGSQRSVLEEGVEVGFEVVVKLLERF